MNYSIELVLFLQKIPKDHIGHFLLKRENAHIRNLLKTETSFLLHNATLRERLWYVENDTKTTPQCKCCDKLVKWSETQYRTYCSIKCMRNDSEIKDRIIKTNIKRYGGNSPSSSNDIVQKAKNTKIEKYGDENYNNRNSSD